MLQEKIRLNSLLNLWSHQDQGGSGAYGVQKRNRVSICHSFRAIFSPQARSLGERLHLPGSDVPPVSGLGEGAPSIVCLNAR